MTKTALELALEALDSGEFADRLARKEETKPVHVTEVERLIDDRDRPDALNHGYVAFQEWADDACPIRILEQANLYNSIDTLALLNPEKFPDEEALRVGGPQVLRGFGVHGTQGVVAAYVIPLGQAESLIGASLRSGELSKMETGEQVSQLTMLLNRNLMLLNPYHYPEIGNRFEAMRSITGPSNIHVPALTLKAGECYHRAPVLASLFRVANIPARVVGYFSIPKDDWAAVCEDIGDFEVTFSRLENGMKLIPECVGDVARDEHPDYGKDPARDEEILDSYEGARISFNPENDAQREKQHHYWVEAKIDGVWTSTNSTRPALSAAIGDPSMDAVFARMSPKRVFVPEVRVQRAEDGFGVDVYFKDTANF